MNSMKFQLGTLTSNFDSAIQEAETNQIVRRIWRKDTGLWKTDDESQRLIKNSLGWLTVTDEMIGVAGALVEHADMIRRRGFRQVMVCGMGGSSLCPEVLRQTFPRREGFPELLVLDSTDPDVIAEFAQRIDIQHCLFVVSSKSGSTIEPLVFNKFWFEELSKHTANPGENFIAITDPGSPMVEMAAQMRFQEVFLNQPDIGGRYSALSYFGLVPAALTGIDINELLSRAKQMSQQCSALMPVKSNPGLQLGVALGEAAKAGRDKLTLIIDPQIASLGLWIEQLIAESTGKEGKGILPVTGEPLGDLAVYGNDRLFVSISIGQLDEPGKIALDTFAAAGHPVIHRELNDLYELGAEFFVWEFATACAGWRLGINPFDQPNVQEAKAVAIELLSAFKKEKQLPKQKEVAADNVLTIYSEGPSGAVTSAVVAALRAQLDTIRPGDYVALLGFIESTPEIDEILQRVRTLIRDHKHCATTVGYGPRFLHSTGQLHKGGPNTGVIFQITGEDKIDFPVPGEDYSFSILKQSQAFGDFRALARRGCRVLGIHIRDNTVTGLEHLLDLTTEAFIIKSATTS
jgi:transaldolase / glucose-6-phosphate isomerase